MQRLAASTTVACGAAGKSLMRGSSTRRRLATIVGQAGGPVEKQVVEGAKEAAGWFAVSAKGDVDVDMA
jgi:hypothetical protein